MRRTSVAVRKTEVAALVPLLEQDWGSPDELAAALIATLDQVRASRVSYVGVIKVAKDGQSLPVWLGLGPYPGQKTAENAVMAALGTYEGTAYVVVPLLSKEGLEARFATLDTPPTPTGDWAEVKRDAQAFKNGWRGSKTPGRREDYLRRVQ
jgi:hypothetical protein